MGVLREYKGLRFHQLPEREQRFLKMRTLRVVIISFDSHPNMKFEIFERLNTGAISLNAQELRNSIYRGHLNSLLHELSKNPMLRALVGTKVPRKRMVDEELILRFFALREGLASYRTPLKRFLNEYAALGRSIDGAKLHALEALFESTVECVGEIFGVGAFRAIDAEGNALDPSVNRALFEAQMLACSWIVGPTSPAQVKMVRKSVAALFNDEKFLDSIQRATGDRARTLKRFRDIVSAISSAGISLRVPFDLTK
jgi:hypothetical protein